MQVFNNENIYKKLLNSHYNYGYLFYEYIKIIVIYDNVGIEERLDILDDLVKKF